MATKLKVLLTYLVAELQGTLGDEPGRVAGAFEAALARFLTAAGGHAA